MNASDASRILPVNRIGLSFTYMGASPGPLSVYTRAMASITFDSELLRQPLPQKTLSAALEFKALYDANSNPVLLSVSKEGALLLLVSDDTGTIQVVNLSSQLGIVASSKVQTLAVTQATNLETFVAFATSAEGGSSDLWVLSPFSPSGSEWHKNLGVGLVFKGAQKSSWNVSKLLLVRSKTPLVRCLCAHAFCY